LFSERQGWIDGRKKYFSFCMLDDMSLPVRADEIKPFMVEAYREKGLSEISRRRTLLLERDPISEKTKDALQYKRVVGDGEILEWITERLQQSHGDENQYHDEAIGRLRGEYNRLQARIDTMYTDKLDGEIDAAYFDRKATTWRGEQDRLLQSVEEHQGANQVYPDEGIGILELSRQAYDLFKKQDPREKRRFLNFPLSNCSWKNGELTANYRQPFNMIAEIKLAHQKQRATSQVKSGPFENWLPSFSPRHR
jgi:site-specific DNA recombinase